MAPKKHHKREKSSSSDSEASTSSNESTHRKKKDRKRDSSEESVDKSRTSKTQRNQKRSSEDYTHSRSDQRSRNRSVSRSQSRDRRYQHRERSKSRENSRRDADRDRRSGHNHNSSRDNERDDGRRQFRDNRDRDDNRRGGFHNRDRRDQFNRDRRGNKRFRSRSRSYDHANAKWGKNEKGDSKNDRKQGGEKEKPNFSLSGKLTEETNTYRGVVIKYSEPPEARKPRRRWRLYPFKGEKALQTLYIHRESGYLIGRDRKVVDLPVDHPSCSKQHAALQYRLVPFTREDGSSGKRVRPYLIDLESANGTFINNKKIEPKKYVELLERDVIKFGFSSREYVLLHENSKDEAMDDDVKAEEDIKVEAEVKEEP